MKIIITFKIKLFYTKDESPYRSKGVDHGVLKSIIYDCVTLAYCQKCIYSTTVQVQVSPLHHAIRVLMTEIRNNGLLRRIYTTSNIPAVFLLRTKFFL